MVIKRMKTIRKYTRDTTRSMRETMQNQLGPQRCQGLRKAMSAHAPPAELGWSPFPGQICGWDKPLHHRFGATVAARLTRPAAVTKYEGPPPDLDDLLSGQPSVSPSRLGGRTVR